MPKKSTKFNSRSGPAAQVGSTKKKRVSNTSEHYAEPKAAGRRIGSKKQNLESTEQTNKKQNAPAISARGRSINKVKSAKDPGDDLHRRLRYQATYGASKALELLRDDADIECLYCEHHEDYLAKLKNGSHVAMQVKTKELGSEPFKLTDSVMLPVLAKFVTLEQDFPGQITSFVIATNLAFVRRAGKDHPPTIVASAQIAVEGGEESTHLKSLLKALIKHDSRCSSNAILTVLSKLHVDESQPRFEDFSLVVADAISELFSAKLPISAAKAAADVLIAGLQKASGLTHPRFYSAVFKSDPEEANLEHILDGKKVVKRHVENWIGSVLDFRKVPGEASTEAVVTESQLIECERILNNVSLAVKNWPTTLDGSTRLAEKTTGELLKRVNSTNSSCTLLLGGPGSGKSAAMAAVANALAPTDCLIALKADAMSNTYDTLEKLQVALGLPVPLIELIKSRTVEKKVFVLIDQVDVLADLSDLHGGRLNVILNLVRRLAGAQNVHVICSCRLFEAEHDSRLSHLDCERVTLPLPEWNDVAQVLAARQVKTAGWPEDMRELLRTPQHLVTFLKVAAASPGTEELYKSYYAMMSRFFQLYVKDKSLEFVTEALAKQIADREELWIPCSKFDADTLKKGIGIGLFSMNEEETKVSFRHQTFFEFVRARSFVSTEDSFSQYVLDRQDALFVRPVVWAVLPYLRDMDEQMYQREVTILWNTASLKYHIRTLLIEFMGMQHNPREFEVQFVFSVIHTQSLESLIWRSVAGSPGWLQHLLNRLLPLQLEKTGAAPYLALPVLQDGIVLQKLAITRLLTNVARRGKSQNELILRSLERLKDWDENLVTFTAGLIAETEMPIYFIDKLIADVSASVPKLASRLVAARLRRELDSAKEKSPPPVDEALPINEYAAARAERSFKNPVRDFVDRTDWYYLLETALAAPFEFVKEVLPIYAEAVQLIRYPSDEMCRYTMDSASATLLRKDEHREDYSIAGSLDESMREIAKSDLTSFLSILDKFSHSDLHFVQRLLIRAISETAEIDPRIGRDYLLGNPRRFALGPSGDEHGDSVILISRLFPKLTENDRRQIEQLIVDYHWYEEELAPGRNSYELSHKVRILQGIPSAFLTDVGKSFLQRNAEVPPTPVRDYLKSVVISPTSSPVSSKQMLQAPLKSLTTVFKAHTDSGADKQWGSSRTRELAGELQALSRNNPKKAVQILKTLRPCENTIAAGYALEGFAESDLPEQDFFALITALIKKKFDTNEFKCHVACAIRNMKQRRKGLSIPNDVLAMLESWLGDADRQRSVREVNQRDESVLWGNDSSISLPTDGNYPILETLTVSLLSEENHSPGRWLKILEDHLVRAESPDVWFAFGLSYLRYLNVTDQTRAQTFLEKLFEKYPSVLYSHSGAILIAFAQAWVSEGVVEGWLKTIRGSSWTQGKQAFGELATMHYLWFPDRQWAAKNVRGILDAPQAQDERIGAAYAAGRLWSEPRYRTYSQEILLELLSKNELKAGGAIAHNFLLAGFLFDDCTKGVLQKLKEAPDLVSSQEMIRIFDKLLELVPFYPQDIFELTMIVVDRIGKDLNDHSSIYATVQGSLVDIALTLQRLSGDHRGQGLQIFEKMIELGIHEAQALLNSFDRRLKTTEQAQQTRPRRRRRVGFQAWRD